jgi:hypothetical protein
MIHGQIIVCWSQIGDRPATLHKVALDRFLKSEASEISPDDYVLFPRGFQVNA